MYRPSIMYGTTSVISGPGEHLLSVLRQFFLMIQKQKLNSSAVASVSCMTRQISQLFSHLLNCILSVKMLKCLPNALLLGTQSMWNMQKAQLLLLLLLKTVLKQGWEHTSFEVILLLMVSLLQIFRNRSFMKYTPIKFQKTYLLPTTPYKSM